MFDRLPDYVTEDNIRLLFVGAGATTLIATLLQRFRVGAWWLLGWLASVLGFFVARWLDWPDPPVHRLVPTIVVGALAAVGLERLRAFGASVADRTWTMLAICGAVWLAIPENRPIVVIAGAVLALALCRPRSDPRWLDSGFVFAISWAVLLGAHIRDFALVGGLLCSAPLVGAALVGALPGGRWRFSVSVWPWFIAGTAALGFASARWVGVAPDASWVRVGVIGASGLVLAAIVRR